MKNCVLNRIVYFLLFLSFASCSSFAPEREVVNVDGTNFDGLRLVETGEDGVIEIVLDEVDKVSEVLSQEKKIRADSIMDPPDAQIEEQNLVLNKEIEKVIAAMAVAAEKNKILIKGAQRAIASKPRFEEYVVQRGDTLMILAFKMYRDTSKWKAIAKWNKESLKNSNIIFAGDKLKIKVFEQNIAGVKQRGRQYIVDRGESLGTISEKLYNGYARYWQDLWENNKILIKKPSDIYAGLVIYYLPYEEVKNNGERKMSWSEVKKIKRLQVSTD